MDQTPPTTTSTLRSPGTDSPESHGLKQPSALNGGYMRVQHMAIPLSRFDNPQFDSPEWSTIPVFVCAAILRRERALLPHIARQLQHVLRGWIEGRP
jgi:hypothetical protein